MLAPGTRTEPVMLAVLPAGQRKPLFVTGKVPADGVNVCVALLHVLPARETLVAVTVQMPGTVITALPLLTSTAVVLVAVKFHADELVTVAAGPRFVVQFENVGGAAVPAALLVKATSLPVDRTPE